MKVAKNNELIGKPIEQAMTCFLKINRQQFYQNWLTFIYNPLPFEYYFNPKIMLV